MDAEDAHQRAAASFPLTGGHITALSSTQAMMWILLCSVSAIKFNIFQTSNYCRCLDLPVSKDLLPRIHRSTFTTTALYL